MNSTNTQFLKDSSLTFTSGFSPGIQSNVTTTYVRAAASGGATGLNASPGFPTGPAVIALDNTLGAYSPYEGRLYVAYVDRNRILGNPSDNTDIFVAYSDNGGLTWNDDSSPLIDDTPVNDDNATTDGF